MLNVFLAIAVDNLADAESLTTIEKEKVAADTVPAIDDNEAGMELVELDKKSKKLKALSQPSRGKEKSIKSKDLPVERDNNLAQNVSNVEPAFSNRSICSCSSNLRRFFICRVRPHQMIPPLLSLFFNADATAFQMLLLCCSYRRKSILE